MIASESPSPTIEIQPANVYVTGRSAGFIEVPFLMGDSQSFGYDFDDVRLEVAGEPELLQPARLELTDNGLVLAYFSKYVRYTRRLPRSLQLHWGNPHSDDCGMEISFHESR